MQSQHPGNITDKGIAMRLGFTIQRNWGVENLEDVIGVPVKAEDPG